MTTPSTKTEVMLLIEAIRREQPRNVKVMQAMDLLERATILLAAKANGVSNVSEPVISAVSKPKTDRRIYMRDLMRRRRAEAKRKADPMETPCNIS